MWLSSALVSYGHKIVKTIGKGTDIQVAMGIAPTKTLGTYYTKVQYKYKGGNYLLWLDEIGSAEDSDYIIAVIRILKTL